MIKGFVQKALRRYNVGMLPFPQLQAYRTLEDDLIEILGEDEDKLKNLIPLFPQSCAQLKQDLFVLMELNFKRNGFFVEFGATNGRDLSNTFLMENMFGWRGILAEPARRWHPQLMENRNCKIETDCVWSLSGATLKFSESSIGELSTLSSFRNADKHARSRRNSIEYPVNTISLNDLLAKYQAPYHIDYLSIDTEGSEYDILANYDFDSHEIKVITCEHNYTALRDKIYKLLSAKGYRRKYMGLSKWDDWYVLQRPAE